MTKPDDERPQTFEEWWEHRPFNLLIKNDCRLAWHARDAEVADLQRQLAEREAIDQKRAQPLMQSDGLVPE